MLMAGVVFSCTKSEQEYISESRQLLQKQSFKEGLSVLNKALEEHQSATLYNLRGVAHFEQGNLDKAIADFNEAVDLDSGDYRPYYNRGKAYFEKEEFSNALIDFSIAMDINPSIPDIYINHANTLFELKEYHLALESYDFAIKLNEGSYLANLNKARTLIVLGNYDKAVGFLARAIEIEPENGEAFYYSAVASHLSGKGEERCLLYARSKELGYSAENDIMKGVCEDTGDEI